VQGTVLLVKEEPFNAVGIAFEHDGPVVKVQSTRLLAVALKDYVTKTKSEG
jgi:hypothetical protein